MGPASLPACLPGCPGWLAGVGGRGFAGWSVGWLEGWLAGWLAGRKGGVSRARTVLGCGGCLPTDLACLPVRTPVSELGALTP